MKRRIMTRAAAAAVVVMAGSAVATASAWAAADASAHSNPSCIGLVSSEPDIVGMSRSALAHGLQAVATEADATPGAALHALIGGPGEKC